MNSGRTRGDGCATEAGANRTVKILAIAGAVTAVTGATLTVIGYDPNLTLPDLGAACLVVGFMGCATAYLCRWQRTFDDWFEAGRRVGYRAGKRDRRSDQVVRLHPRRRDRGLLSETPVRAVASHGPSTRWDPPNPN